MQRFAYQARDSSGQATSGVLTANDLADATRLLRRDGKAIVSLKPEKEAPARGQGFSMGGRHTVKRDEVIFFCTQLAVMVDTGVPLADSLDCIIEGTQPGGMRDLLLEVCEDVKGGLAFSDALEKHPKAFNTLFVAMVRASEASGTLGAMLQRISEYLEQDRDIRKKIKGAMTYPICMFAFCIVVVIGLLLFVLPRFEKIYQGKGALLPLPTRVLLGMSGFVVGYWPLLLVGVAAAGAGVFLFARSEEGRRVFDRMKLSIPVLGSMTRKASLARSLKTMSTMISTGVSMLDGLQLTSEVSGNYYYGQVWRTVASRVEEGATLSEELANQPLIPKPITQMISAGERTGQLGPVMNRAAGFCENDLKVAIKTVTDMIEPIMIVGMGIIVGSIAISLLLPIFSVSKLMAH